MSDEVRMNVPYFQAPNSIFDGTLTEHELIVYLYLCRCGNNGGQAFPSYQTIADKCGISRSTAMRAIQSLAKRKLIAKLKRPKANNDNETNIYYVLPPSVPETLPSITQTPPPSVREEPPSVSVIPNKEILYKEIDIDKEIQIKENESSSFFDSLLGIWERQYQIRTGKKADVTDTERQLLSDLINKGISEMEFHRYVKEYLGHKRRDYSLECMINSSA